MLDAIEEQVQQNQINMLPDNAFFRTLTQISEWLIDKTENSGGKWISKICQIRFSGDKSILVTRLINRNSYEWM